MVLLYFLAVHLYIIDTYIIPPPLVIWLGGTWKDLDQHSHCLTFTEGIRLILLNNLKWIANMVL